MHLNHSNDPALIYIIPGWVYRAALRNKFNIIDLAWYTRLRQIISAHDIAEVLYLNSSVERNPLNWISGSSYGLRVPLLDIYNEVSTLTPAELTEYTQVLTPMSMGDDVIQGVLARLNGEPDDLPSEDDVPYKIIYGNNGIIYVVVESSFMRYTLDPQLLLTFVASLLKSCYGIGTLASVSGQTLFQKYLQLLKIEALKA